MPVVIEIIEHVKDMDLVRSIMSKGELPNVICTVYDTIPKDKESQQHYMNCIMVMANSHLIADVIIS